MNIAKKTLAVAIAATALSAPALAQDAAFQLPEQCTASSTTGGMDHSTMGQGNQSGGMDAGMMDMMGMGDMDIDAMLMAGFF